MTNAVEMYIIECRTCGVTCNIPQKLWNARGADGAVVFCPNGHEMHPSAHDDVTKLRRDLAEVTRNRDWHKSRREESEKNCDRLIRSNRSLRACIKRMRRS